MKTGLHTLQNAVVLGLAALAIFAAPSLARQEATPATESTPAASEETFLIRKIFIQYATENSAHPVSEDVLAATMPLVMDNGVLRLPREGEAAGLIPLAQIAETAGEPRMDSQTLQAVQAAVAARILDMGFAVVSANIDPGEFKLVREDRLYVDLRPAGNDELTVIVLMGEVTSLTTKAKGERFDPAKDTIVNNSSHAKILEHSPVKPATDEQKAPDGPARFDLIRRDQVDEYTARLSRHPGRLVEYALGVAGTGPADIDMEYLVTENKPWLIFGQISNTGSASTSRLREHLGFIHNQLTDNDDTLQIGYHTANFKDSHTLYASYEAPWMKSRELRWRVSGSWYDYVASEVGLAGADFEGNGWDLGAQAIWNFFQKGDLFVDLLAGANLKHVSVDNNLAAISGSDNFFVPGVFLRLQQHRGTFRTDATAGFEFNIGGLAGTDDDLDALGRIDADKDWLVFKADATHSFYLEPFLPELFGTTPGEFSQKGHEIALALHAQAALGSRLIPNEQIVAGGLYTVRGYPYALVAGDSALIGSVEYRYHVTQFLGTSEQAGDFFGDPFRWRPQYELGPTDWDLVLKAFLDAGRVMNSDRQSFEADSTLVGIGIGAEFSIRRNFSARLDWGFALKDVLDSTGNERENSGHNELSFVITVVY